MKKWIVILAIVLIAAITALVIWQPWANQKDLPQAETMYRFKATVLEINGQLITVEPLEGTNERNSSDLITFSAKELEEIPITQGSTVEIVYNGQIRETYPAAIDAESWKLLKTPVNNTEYTELWLDKTTATQYDSVIFDHVTITQIYTNCFFGKTLGYTVKLNGSAQDFCVGDQVSVTYENAWYDEKSSRAEVDLLSIELYYDPTTFTAAKPVIYLYPERQTAVSVFLELNGELTCAYPQYNDGWQVTAAPDGTLTDAAGQTYNYLYWEGETNADYDLTKGFCVKGADTAAFLEDALEKLGLTRGEANEFIVYWLPLMEGTPYNIISFQTSAYTQNAQLHIDPQPDTLIRVFMAWRPSEEYLQMQAQQLTAPERIGFTAVEWGGTKIAEN